MHERTVWLIHTARFHARLVPLLAQRGVRVTYVCTAPIDAFSVDEGCTLHSAWAAMAGQGPAGDAAASVAPPDPEILHRLREDELVTMYMMERLNYERFRLHELRSIYLKYVGYWHAALEGRRPDAVVFLVTPHMGFDYVLYALCRVLGLRTLIVERTFISDRLVLLDAIDAMPSPPPHPAGDQPSAPGATTDNAKAPSLRSYYQIRDRKFVTSDPGRGVLALGLAILRHVARCGHQFLTHLPRLHARHYDSIYVLSYAFRGYTPRTVVHLWHRLRDGVVMERARWAYQQAARKPDLSCNYVYFSLNYQPEKSTLPLAAAFPDQLSALDLLVQALPPGWIVYVKEHPRQFWDPPRFRIARSERFYRDLRRHGDRVQLVSTGFPSSELIAHARCVATPTGTAGWEAVIAGVPALVFGTPWYVHCPGIRHITSRASCVAALEAVAAGRVQLSVSAIARYREWLTSIGTFAGYFEDQFEAMSALTPQANAESFAEAIAARLADGTTTSPRSANGMATARPRTYA